MAYETSCESWVHFTIVVSLKSKNKLFKKFKFFQTASAIITESNWICEHCGKAYKYKFSLMEHMQTAHSDERPHKCDTCGAR